MDGFNGRYHLGSPLGVGDPERSAAVGLDPNYTGLHKFGERNGVGITWEPVWGGASAYPFQDTPQTLEVVSDSADDAAAGVGTRTIRVEGLDENWLEQSVDATLDGITPVALTGSWIRVNGAYQLSSGSAGINSGTVSVRITAAGSELARLEPLTGQTLQAIYAVPANKSLFVRRWFCVAGKGDEIDARLVVREFGDGFRTKQPMLLYQYGFTTELSWMKVLPKSDILVMAIKVSGAALKIRSTFCGVLVTTV